MPEPETEPEARDADDAQGPTLVPLATQPKLVLLIFAVFLLLIGLPAALYAWAGRWDVAAGLVLLFLMMVVATGFAFKTAVEAERSSKR